MQETLGPSRYIKGFAMIWASAISKEIESNDALDEAIKKLQKGLQGKTPDALFVFVSPHHSDAYDFILEHLNREIKAKHLIGCSGGGVIGAGKEVEDNPGLSLTAAILPGVKIQTLNISDADLPDADSSPTAWESLLQVKASENPHFVLLLSPFMGKSDDLLAGLDYAFPHAHKIGGIASGLRNIGERTMFLDGQRVSDGAVVMSLSGDFRLDTLVAQGCRGVGGVYTITECEGNMLIELDGKPALKVLTEIYETASAEDRLLMNRALFVGLITDPMIPWPPQHGDYLIRNVLGTDIAKRSLAVGADLRQGQALRFHLRDSEAAAQDLKSILQRHHDDSVGQDVAGALLFSCLGRGEAMYGLANHDSSLFMEHFGDVAMGGFFCNGEIGPVGTNTYIHGFTSSFGIFREKPAS
jgi:small ligand-binding sensory domain FIST